ncbi:MAG TPA: Flp family type IVb pilin [Pseudolabrys sp.]|nr:Flp family type IVb pilin [Pseudolabrys sp.]
MRRFIPRSQIIRFLPAREGATAIEYALIASGVSIAIVGAVTTLGSGIQTLFYNKLLNLF